MDKTGTGVIRCEHGHVIGIMSDAGLRVRHQGRAVYVAHTPDRAALVTITCNRCGGTVDVAV